MYIQWEKEVRVQFFSCSFPCIFYTEIKFQGAWTKCDG